MPPKAVLIELAALRFTKKKRRGICPRRVEELRAEIESGRDVYPIRVNALGDGYYTVKDGRHRIQAHLAAGFTEILAFVDNTINRIRKLLGRFINRLFPRFGGFFIRA